jgi:hypothetical protein
MQNLVMAENLTREVRGALLDVLARRAENVEQLEGAFGVADRHAAEIAREIAANEGDKN